MMRRRTLIAALGGAAAAWPFVAGAQQDRRKYRLGNLTLLQQRPYALFDQRARAVFVEGKNLIVDRTPTTPQELPTVAARVVAAEPDVILAGGDGPAHAALQAHKAARHTCRPPCQRRRNRPKL